MLDPDTFLTTRYVLTDDFFQRKDVPVAPWVGRPPAFSKSEVVTPALFGQWSGFGGERGFWRWASRHLRGAFPGLPCREQFNRLVRAAADDLARLAVALAEELGGSAAAYQALDSTGVGHPRRQVAGPGLAVGPGRHRLQQPPGLV